MFPWWMPDTLAAPLLWHQTAAWLRVSVEQEQGCVRHSALLALWGSVRREGMQQPLVTLFPPRFIHLPLSSHLPSLHPINLPPSLDSSPVFLSSLSFSAVPQCGPRAVLPSAAEQDVKEAGKKPSDSSLSASLALFPSLHCTGNSSPSVCMLWYRLCWMITVADVLWLCEDFPADMLAAFTSVCNVRIDVPLISFF